MGRKAGKSPNGTGQSLTVFFDQSDPQEANALAMSKLLASKHGRRKDAVISLLSALYEVYQETGKLLSATEIANAVQAAQGGGRHASMGFTYAVAGASVEPPPEPLPFPKETRPWMHQQVRADDDQPQITVSETKRLSADDQAKRSGANFLKSAGGLSAGFFD